MLVSFPENQQADPTQAKRLARLLHEEEEEFDECVTLGTPDDILEAIEVIRIASSYLVSRLGSDKATKAFDFAETFSYLDRKDLSKELLAYLKG
jgi:hypothetical protein